MTSDQPSGLDSDLIESADGAPAEPAVITSATGTATSHAAPAFVPVEPPPAPVLVASESLASAAPVTVRIEATPVAESAPVQATPVVAPEPVAPEPVAPEPVAPEPVAPAPSAIVVPSAPVEPSKPIILPAADKSSLMQMVQAAGLQWVETDPVRAAQASSTGQVTAIKLGREPKPVIQASSAPLVQVETRR